MSSEALRGHVESHGYLIDARLLRAIAEAASEMQRDRMKAAKEKGGDDR